MERNEQIQIYNHRESNFSPTRGDRWWKTPLEMFEEGRFVFTLAPLVRFSKCDILLICKNNIYLRLPFRILTRRFALLFARALLFFTI